MLVLCIPWQSIYSFFIDANFCDFRALCVQLTQHTAGCYQCQESYSPHMATASRITPKRESEQLWRNSQRGIQGDNFLVGLLKYFSLIYPIRRLDWFALQSPQFIASLTWTAFLPSMGLPVRRTLTQSSTAPSRLQTIRYWRAQARIIEFIN